MEDLVCTHRNALSCPNWLVLELDRQLKTVSKEWCRTNYVMQSIVDIHNYLIHVVCEV